MRLTSAVCILIAALVAPAFVSGDEHDDVIDKMVKKWSREIRDAMSNDKQLAALAAKYPLVVLHSRQFFAKRGGYGQSTYSFLHETIDRTKNFGDVQLQFHNGGELN